MPRRGNFYGDDMQLPETPRRRGNFYGDGNSVDIAQRHAPATLTNAGDTATENIVKAAMSARPIQSSRRVNDDVKAKRLEDNIRDSQVGVDTTADDEALLRQSNIPGNRTNATVPDEHTANAERIVRTMQAGPMKHYGMFADPGQRAKFVEGMARELRGGPATPATQPEEQEKPFLNKAADDNFWGDRAQLEKAGRMVRPKKL
jgi:hypothetical protein